MTYEESQRKFFYSFMTNVHTALPAKILKFDHENMRAEIELLKKKKVNDTEYTIPPILNVPVGFILAGDFYIRPPYKKGDTVQVVFNESAIDKLIVSGKPEDSQIERVFSLDDAVIVSGIKMQSTSKLSSDNKNDLLIANKNINSKVILKQNGDIVIESDSSVYLGSEAAAEGAALGTSLKAWLDAHVHPDPVSGTSGSPTIPSPNPSTKVKLE